MRCVEPTTLCTVCWLRLGCTLRGRASVHVHLHHNVMVSGATYCIARHTQHQFMQRWRRYAEEVTEPLAWLPATQAAIALRLLCLDSAVHYSQGTPAWRDVMPAMRYIQQPVLTPQRDRVHTVCGPALQSAGESIMPQLLQAFLPTTEIEFAFDVDAMRRDEDDSHLRHQVPAGMPSVLVMHLHCSSRPPQGLDRESAPQHHAVLPMAECIVPGRRVL